MEHALEYLHAKRIEFEPIRISLRHLLKEIGSYNIKKLKDDKNIETHKLDRKYSISSEADEFIDAAIYYICDFETSKSFSTKIEGTKRKLILSSPSSYLEQKLFDIKHYLPFSIESDEVAWQTSFEDSMALHCNIDLEELIDREINNLRLKWSLVCESFVKLKIKVILKSKI